MTRALAAAVAVSIFLTPCTSRGTAVTVCANKAGVVVSADSKLTVIGDERTAHVNKIVRVGDRAVVTMTGVAVWTELKYDFWSWLRRATAGAKRNPTPSDVAEALRKSAEQSFARRGEALAKPGMATYFIVAGLDVDGVAVWEVHLEPEGSRVTVQKTRKFGPATTDAEMFGYGFPPELPFDDKRGALWTAVRARSPEWLLRAGKAQQLTQDQRAAFCGIPISVAAERAPYIGLPITQAIVTPESKVIERTWLPPAIEAKDLR